MGTNDRGLWGRAACVAGPVPTVQGSRPVAQAPSASGPTSSLPRGPISLHTRQQLAWLLGVSRNTEERCAGTPGPLVRAVRPVGGRQPGPRAGHASLSPGSQHAQDSVAGRNPVFTQRVRLRGLPRTGPSPSCEPGTVSVCLTGVWRSGPEWGGLMWPCPLSASWGQAGP